MRVVLNKSVCHLCTVFQTTLLFASRDIESEPTTGCAPYLAPLSGLAPKFPCNLLFKGFIRLERLESLASSLLDEIQR